MRHLSVAAAGFLGIALVAGCASGGGGARTTPAGGPTPVPPAAPPPAAVAQDTTREGGLGSQYPSSYRRHPNPPVLIRNATRSEEHTSELQSLAYLVCRLLLEKKKKKEQYKIVDESVIA